MMREPPSDQLTQKQRLSLFHTTSLPLHERLTIPDGDINVALFLRIGARSVHFSSANLGPLALHARGVEDAATLRRLGFDSLSLVDRVFATEAAAAFGADAVKAVFLIEPHDAVAVAGCDAMHILNVTVEDLVRLCAGAPLEATAVLQQSPSVAGVTAKSLLDSGLRGKQLHALGITASILRNEGASDAEVVKLMA